MITEKEQINNLLTSGIKTVMMYRVMFSGKRLYVLPEPFGVYSGLTGALSASTFKGSIDAKRLDKWRDSMISHLGTQEKQESYLNAMADFGTAIHEVLVTIQKDGKLDWALEAERASEYFANSARKNNIEPNSNVIRQQTFEYCKAAASLMQFVYEEVSEIYSIEGMAKCESLSIVTPIDLTFKDKKGRMICCNIKTSNQISDHQREQASMEKMMWNETYPDCQVELTAILRTKDWRKSPTFEYEIIKDNSVSDVMQRLQLCKSNEKSTYLNYPKSVPTFTGVTKAGEMPVIEYKTLQEIFNQLT